jgi:D-amino-acid dehydrogenase
MLSGPGGYDVAVVGGGLVGTALAYELVTTGARVVLVDRHDQGRATDAGAGILSPESISVEDPSWFALAMAAGEHYRALVPALEADETRTTGYAVTGLLRVGFREWEDELFATNIALARARCPDEVEEITVDEARRRFPPLGDIRTAWYSPRAARVDGRAMTAALLDAAVADGPRPDGSAGSRSATSPSPAMRW